MIIVDNALRQRAEQGNPIRVALIGAGYMGRGIALQILSTVPGIRLVGVANRTLEAARCAYEQAGIDDVAVVESAAQLERALDRGRYAITEDPLLLCQCARVEAIVEATGTIEYAARVVLQAINSGKHVIMMNAELDATLGPILKVYADRAGVMITASDGDQPGVIMNLVRYVRAIGCRPVLAGNIKGLHDPYRTPETQKAYAARYRQKPRMVTSFADGTKISMEMAIVANGTGFRAGQRGMYGPDCQELEETLSLFPQEQMLDGGLVDYVVGARPAGGIFVIGYNDRPIQQQYLNYYKMGKGPLYVFHTPYHLCHVDTPLTVARAVLFGDAALAPLGGPVCDVVTAAKRDLKAGEILDGIGGFTTYGLLENSDICRAEDLLPMGLAEGCRLKRPVAQDQVLRCSEVEFPGGRLADRLRQEQTSYFG